MLCLAVILSISHIHVRLNSESVMGKLDNRNEKNILIFKVSGAVMWTLLPKEYALVVIIIYLAMSINLF